MPSLCKPSAAAMRRIIAEQSSLEFTYSEVGATAGLPQSPLPVPNSYAVDHTRAELGAGAAVFERAKAALRRWEQFNLGWLQAFPRDTPLRLGETVLVVARAGGLWWTNAARIVYTLDDGGPSLPGGSDAGAVRRFGFAYGTLPGHVESGEERFLIVWDLVSDRVYFDIGAFSRPRHFLVRLNRRRARAMQKRFAAEAAAAIQRAVTNSDNFSSFGDPPHIKWLKLDGGTQDNAWPEPSEPHYGDNYMYMRRPTIVIDSMRAHRRIAVFASAAFCLIVASALPRVLPAQSINPTLTSNFTLTQILVGGPLTALPFATSIDAQIGQMTFGSDGRLYVATMGGSKGGDSDQGIVRFDYSPTGVLSNKTKVSTVPSTSVAFHQDPVLGSVMYISEAIDIFGANAIAKNGVLRRMTDTNNDGTWGGAGDVNQVIVNNVPVEREHRMNQIQIIGNTLYTGVGTLTTDGHNEAAYTGTISYIQDLTTLSNNTTTINVAGFNEVFLTTTASGGTPSNSTTPLTSTDPSKLRVHSIGLRNPFGTGLDGDGNLWASMNNDQGIPGIGTPSDLFFKAQRFANYGFSYEYTGEFDSGAGTNRADGTPYTSKPEVVAAGFSVAKNVTSITAEGVVTGYNAAVPNGSLGPSAAVGGVGFASANGFKLRWQKDAFIGRWTFQDVVAVDIDTGEVVQIATGFNRSLAVSQDPFGNILVAEAPLNDTDRARIFRISPNNAFVGAHLLDWNENLSGNWSDRLSWGGDFDGDGTIDAPFTVNNNDRLVPHQWATERFAVSISRQVANLQVTLDQNAHIELLTLGNAGFYLGDNNLFVAAGKTLTLDDKVAIEFGGKLSGSGTVAGTVENRHGSVQLTTTGLHIGGNYVQLAGGTLLADIGAGGHGQLSVDGLATLGGALTVNLLGGFMPAFGASFDILNWGTIGGTFATTNLPALGGGLGWNTSQLYASGLLSVDLLGDFNHDAHVDAADYVVWRKGFGTTYTQADYDTWRAHFGATAGSGAGASVAVPEPAAIGSLVLVAIGCYLRRRRSMATPTERVRRIER